METDATPINQQLASLSQSLHHQLEGIQKSLDALTLRFDATESQVADMHLVHERIKRTEAAYTRYQRTGSSGGGGGGLLPIGEMAYELDTARGYTASSSSHSADDDANDYAEEWRPGNIGPVGHHVMPMRCDPCPCCVIQ